jgi:hypothetical protein
MGALVALGALVLSCDSFYGTSWGDVRKYDSDKIEITSGNVDEWVEASIGNPALAVAVMQAISDRIAVMPYGTERTRFQSASVALAFEASKLTTSLLSNISEVQKILDEKDPGDDQFIRLFNILVKGMDEKVGDYLGEIFKPIGGWEFPDNPNFTDDFKAYSRNVDTSVSMLLLMVSMLKGEKIATLDDMKDWAMGKNSYGFTVGVGLKIGDTDIPPGVLDELPWEDILHWAENGGEGDFDWSQVDWEEIFWSDALQEIIDALKDKQQNGSDKTDTDWGGILGGVDINDLVPNDLYIRLAVRPKNSAKPAPKAQLLAAYMNFILTDDTNKFKGDPLLGTIKDMIDGFDLNELGMGDPNARRAVR